MISSIGNEALDVQSTSPKDDITLHKENHVKKNNSMFKCLCFVQLKLK